MRLLNLKSKILKNIWFEKEFESVKSWLNCIHFIVKQIYSIAFDVSVYSIISGKNSGREMNNSLKGRSLNVKIQVDFMIFFENSFSHSSNSHRLRKTLKNIDRKTEVASRWAHIKCDIQLMRNFTVKSVSCLPGNRNSSIFY